MTESTRESIADEILEEKVNDLGFDHLVELVRMGDSSGVSSIFLQDKFTLDNYQHFKELILIAAKNNDSELFQIILKEWERISKRQIFTIQTAETINLILDAFVGACESSSVDIVEVILSHPLMEIPYRFQCDHEFMAPVFYAITNLKIVQLYYNKYRDLKSCYVMTDYGFEEEYEIFPLNHAVEMDADMSIVKYLLDMGADVDQPSGRRDTTALYSACFLRNEDNVKLLLKHGADPELVYDTQSDRAISFLTTILEILKVSERCEMEFHNKLTQNSSLVDVSIISFQPEEIG